MGYIMGVDAGTSSFKAALYDEKGSEVVSANYGYSLLTPSPQQVELEPQVYWEAFKSVVGGILQKANQQRGILSSDIKALAIDSQGETLICVDKNGQPLGNAIVWLDNRSYKEADEIRVRFGTRKVYDMTGQPEITATWPVTKMMWLREHRRDIYHKIYKYLLLEDYLIFRLTGKFIGEKSLYSSSLLLDIHRGSWWSEMLDFAGISEKQLVHAAESGERVGHLTQKASEETGLNRKTLVVTGALDQAAGMLGAGNIKPGMVTETTGSCLAVCANIETPASFDEKWPIPCHYHAIPRQYYVILWSQSAGMTLEWFKERFYNISEEAKQERNKSLFAIMDEDAQGVPPGCDGLLMLPYINGAAFPEFDPLAKGVFYGVTLKHTRAHFTRAILESIAFMLKRDIDILERMGIKIPEIRALGGGAMSTLWNGIKADVTGKRIVTLKNRETACLGAAILAGTGAGIYDSTEQACTCIAETKDRFEPDRGNAGIYKAAYRKFEMLYENLKMMFREDSVRGGE